ncbi:MAG TPA: fused MFS/spermidine synthase [Chloroflexota bacterium]|jgi:spermidine synthase
MAELAAPTRPRIGAPARAGLGGVGWAALLAFCASAATLVLELIAGRMLAPYIGSSLYTWTSIIGVVLAGISLGNWAGGRLADRRASARLLGTLFLLGALAALASLAIVPLLGRSAPGQALGLLPRIFFLTTLGFFPPSFVLAMITPLVIRRTLPDVRHTGRVVGLIYAVATAGSLVGNFATGFVLTAYFDVTTIVLGITALLVVLGLLAGSWWRHGAASAVAADPRLNGRVAGVGSADRPAPAGAARPDLVRAGRLDLAGNLPLANTVVALASFATMGVELAASRILAPYLGLSLYSWTGIIGVVLLAITIGNYTGGVIADRSPSQPTLGLTLFLGGLGALAILVLVELLDMRGYWSSLGLVERIVVETAVVFFLPIMLLGLTSPQVIRLTVTDLARAGRVSGEVYAWSTAGAIVGTFATGWYLIAALGVHTLVFAMGAILIALALLVGRFWRTPPLLPVLLLVSAVAFWQLSARDAIRSRCDVETSYFCIKVGQEDRPGVGTVRTLVLDHLVHSYVKVGDPSYLGYVHEEVQTEITRYLEPLLGQHHILVIGGGGYTYPRWVEAKLPDAQIEVVEIDPGVTRVAHDYFAMPADTRIVSHNLDGRQYVQELAPKGAYTMVVQDAVNDLSVPYHIMTREYNDHVRALLKPGGVYLLTVIDLFRDGQLLRAAIRTMKQTFPTVQLLAAGPAWESGGANVWVIAGSQNGLDVEQLRTRLGADGTQVRTAAMPPERLEQYLAQGPQVVLTDEYAPVDNLIAILFRSRG